MSKIRLFSYIPVCFPSMHEKEKATEETTDSENSNLNS